MLCHQLMPKGLIWLLQCTNICMWSQNNSVCCTLAGSANSPIAMALFHGETHTLATTAGKIIIYTLATTLSSPHSSGNPTLARTGSGKAPLQGQDLQGQNESDVDEVLSQLEQLVDLLEQYFHPSNNGRSVSYGSILSK